MRYIDGSQWLIYLNVVGTYTLANRIKIFINLSRLLYNNRDVHNVFKHKGEKDGISNRESN